MHSDAAQPQPPSQVDHTHAHDHATFDFDKLDCYQLAKQFNALVPRLIQRGHRELRDQLTRAALSIPLNIAESAGRVAPGEKAHFIAIARGSAMECAAIVDVLVSGGIAPLGLCREARVLLIRITQMLTKLERRLRTRGGGSAASAAPRGDRAERTETC
jgi:four helix bundle protein